MIITVVARSPDLPHVIPVRCDWCDAQAHLISGQLDMSHRKLTETWTYKCETCEREITRKEDS
jgi:hypothetical protein